MTSKTSSAKTHPAASFMRFSLKKQTPLTLLVTAFTLLVCPGMLIKELAIELSNYENVTIDSDDFNIYALFILGASAVLMFMLLLNNFGFLYSKKASDMYGALPLTRNETLFTRTVSSYVGAFFNMTVSYLGLCTVNFLPDSLVKGVSVETAVITYLFMVLILTVATFYSLLFVICSGGYFNAIIAFAAVNLAPVFVVAVLILNAIEGNVGINIDYINVVYASPIAYMFWKFTRIPLAENTGTTLLAIEKISVWSILGLVLFAVICIVAAIKLFAVRKSETAGEAYSFGFVPTVITVLVSMAGGYLIGGLMTGFMTNFGLVFWILFVIGALLCAVTFGAVISKGFKSVKSSLKSGAVSAAVMIVLVIVTSVLSGIAEVRVPKAENIEEIRLFYDEDVVFTDNFEPVVDLHAKIVENIKNDYHSEDEKYYEVNNTMIQNISDIRIKYVMKNGLAVERLYWNNYPDMDNLYPELLRLMQTDQFLSKYDKCATDSEDNIVIVTFRGEKYEYNDLDLYECSAVLNNAQGKEFLKILKSEFKAADTSVFEEECYVVSIHGDTFEELYLPASFTDTMDYLSDYLILNEGTNSEAVYID